MTEQAGSGGDVIYFHIGEDRGQGVLNGRGGQRSDYTEARERMVAEQLERRGIRDRRVLEAMRRVPRHLFVDPSLIHQAYDDHPLPIGEEQTISQPYMVALMTAALELRETDRVLEIGTGSGYQTAILAELARWVYSIERIPRLAEHARTTLEGLGYRNVSIRIGDGSRGWPEAAPFDAVLVTAGAPETPPSLLAQLQQGGRLVIPVGSLYSQTLRRVIKGEGGLQQEDLAACVFVKLVGEEGWGEEGA